MLHTCSPRSDAEGSARCLLRPIRLPHTRNDLVARRSDALAKRFDIMAIGTLEANVSLALVDPRRTRVRAYGSFSATDVSLNGPMGESTTLQIERAPFETFFVDEESTETRSKYDSDEDDAYDEPLDEGRIDLGELVAQHMYLYVSDREATQYREWGEEFAPGEVVWDSDPELG